MHFAAKNSLKQLYSALNSDIPCTRVLLFVKKVTNVQNCRAWIVLEKILVVNTTSHESRLLRRKKVQAKSYPLFGLIATVFNFCFSPCSTIRDYLEEGSTSLPFYFTPIWQVKLVTIISINDLSFLFRICKKLSRLLTLSHVSFMCVGWLGCGNLITSCWKISKAHGDKI